MKNYFVRAVVAALVFTIVYFLLDFITGNIRSFREYAVQAIVFVVIFVLSNYLYDKFRWFV